MKKYFIYVSALIAVIIGALTYQQVNKLPQPESALYYQQSRDVKPFKLMDHKGQAFTKKEFEGKWSFVFFWLHILP